jgi:uncharacterized protein YqeY
MNTLESKIQRDLTEAMKAHQESEVSALRLIKTAIQNEKVNGTYHELSDNDIIKIIQKLAKQYQESIDIYRQAGRNELADAEQAEMDVLAVFLPVLLSEKALRTIISEYIENSGFKSIKDMGAVMKFLSTKYPNQYDGKMASTIVRELLSK